MFTDTDAQAVANANGIVIASPSSRYEPRRLGSPHRRDLLGDVPSVDPNTNPDLLLTRAILVEAQRRYAVDPDRVYLLGHSNGAFFAQLAAAALNDRVAAFASSSGGNDRCANTWSCSFQGVGTTCATLRTRAGWCSCTGAEKPVTIPMSGRMPPGYLAHGTSDPLVSVQYTCDLESLMLARGATVVTALRDDGHNLPSTFVSTVWPFFRDRRRR
ncbi:MAG: hypothetical protein U0325_35780 [Polyangiales bacterium]